MIWTPHATVATVVEQNGRFLLVDEIIDGARVLNQPAGHVEKGESILDAAVRETLEETGWHVKPTHLVGVYTYTAPNDVTYYRFCFAADAGHLDEQATLDEGIVGPVWLTEEDIRRAESQWRSPLLIRCIEDFIKGKRYPLDLIYEHAQES